MYHLKGLRFATLSTILPCGYIITGFRSNNVTTFPLISQNTFELTNSSQIVQVVYISFAVKSWTLYNNIIYTSSWISLPYEVAKDYCKFYGGTLALLKTPDSINVLKVLDLRKTGKILHIFLHGNINNVT